MLNADLDLMFVDSDQNITRDGEAEQYAGELLRILGTVSEHGLLYEIDIRLRPEGRNGPLAMDERGYRSYLRTRASLWERQSLTRMRFICGNVELGRRIMDFVEDFVYGSPLPRDWIEQITTMRRKMEAKGRMSKGGSSDLKRGAGGMVDIEFIVQMIQLRFGRELPSLRSRSIYDLLRTEDLPLITVQERRALAEHYGFYRRVEAMIRLALDGRNSTLPLGPALQTLARCSAYLDKEEFRLQTMNRMKAVRNLFTDICNRLAGETQ
jgi:glutamate-ammonia-ligase adenylyltransferase